MFKLKVLNWQNWCGRKIAPNGWVFGEEGDLEHECSTLAQCLIVVQKFNLQRQAPFLPMQC